MFKKLALAFSLVTVLSTPALAQGFFDSIDGGNFNIGSNGAGGSLNTDFGRIRLDTNGNFGFNGSGVNVGGNFNNGNFNGNFGGGNFGGSFGDYGSYGGPGAPRTDGYGMPPSPGLISAFQSQGDAGDSGRRSFKTGEGPAELTKFYSNPTSQQLPSNLAPTMLGGMAPVFGLGSGYFPDFISGNSPIPVGGFPPGFPGGFSGNFNNGNFSGGFNNGTFSGSFNGVGGSFNPGTGNFNLGGNLPIGGGNVGFNTGNMNISDFGDLGSFFP